MVCASASEILNQATPWPLASSRMLLHRLRWGDETRFQTDG
jgi:hypothetical protein